MPDESTAPAPATILNVDDNEANRYAVTRMLRRAGFAIEEAGDGQEALRKVAGLPDLVILDVNLPDLDGFEVCRRIKADPATASIPVLHMSASFILSEDRTRGLDQGADGYLIRPVEAPELIATVRALLRIRSAEKASRTAALQWQATFDAIGDGVCLLDRDGRVLRSNRAAGAILGRDPAAIAGRPLADFFEPPAPPDDLALRGRHYRVGIDPILDDGAVVGSVCILTDVTDRRLLEDESRRRAEALTEADRRKDEFLAMLAHELRNPLAPILNAFEVMKLVDASPPELAKVRQIAERQVRHLARLVDDLLDVSRITSTKVQLRLEPVDLAEVIASVVEAARPTIEARRHALTLAVEPGPLPVLGDPTRLDQVLTNLLNNAAKYTEPGGRITLTAGRVGGMAEVRVADSGIGIAPEMLPRVFDLFAQADRALDRAQGGLGIGLTLVRRLVELHGGSVAASSAGPGLGSEFVVRLPLGPRAEGADPSRSAGAHPLARPSPLRILVVDDQVDSASMLARLLRGRGHEVRVAAEGTRAIAEAAGGWPQVVLLDIGLPGMDGYEVARRVRDLPGMGAALLVALTGYGQEDDLRLAREAGFDHHLVKPADFTDIERLLALPRR